MVPPAEQMTSGTVQFSRPQIMGIVNVTHDSFFSSSRAAVPREVVALADLHVRAGAGIIDVGGESSRPGSSYVAPREELRRVVPAIEAIRAAHPTVTISVDTRKASVAREALDAGASMVNDISGLRDDPALAELVAERNVPVCIMHMRGTPETMQQNPRYQDVVREICGELEEMVAGAEKAGVRREQIIIDPGIGFGKEFSHNWSILRHLQQFTHLGYPLLVGVSRKRFLRPDTSPEMRLHATLAAQLWCTMTGVSILRVHDVAPMVEMIDALEAIATAT